MMDIATLAARGIHEHRPEQAGEEAADAILQSISPVVRKLFLLLHGSYGTLFTSKFATGQMIGKHDKGTISAMRVWDAKLSRFTGDVIETASSRLAVDHPKFPPNLPEFEAMCQAAAPVKTIAQEQGWTALPAPAAPVIKVDTEMKNDGLDWARRILYRVEHGDKSISRFSIQGARTAMGLEGRQAWQ